MNPTRILFIIIILAVAGGMTAWMLSDNSGFQAFSNMKSEDGGEAENTSEIAKNSKGYPIVELKKGMLTPSELEIKYNGKVVFQNADNTMHLLHMSPAPLGFKAKNLNPKDSVTIAFPTKGTFKAYSQMSPAGKKLVITVK